MQKIIYMDNAATTKIDPVVFKSMLPFLKEQYGNPSSIYSLGRESREAIENAREKIGHAIGADNKEIYITSGGSEADNWAIKGVAFANQEKGKHIITSSIEHHAVLNTCEYLKRHGFDITYIPVKENGIIDIEQLEKSIRKDTILISVMFANNEVGSIQPIEEIGAIAKKKGVYFHTDAVQAVGHVPIDVNKMNIYLLSLSAHKFHGPKGVGALYIRRGTNISNMIHGGGQEFKKRAGTENIAGIVGLGTAIEISVRNISKDTKYLINLRDKLINGLIKSIPDTILNGDPKLRLPGNVNVCFKYIEGESILLLLDSIGVCASSGSACTSGSLEPSHVLLAIGRPHEIAHGSLRLTLSRENTEQEVDFLLDNLPGIVKKLRDMSPLIK